MRVTSRLCPAVALTVRVARYGSVVLDLRAAREQAADADPDPNAAEPEAPADLPWPDPGAWAAACAASPIVASGDGPRRPLRMLDGSLWLDRYWRQESQVAEELLARADEPVAEPDGAALAASLSRLFPGAAADDQRRAAAVCALSRVSVLAGGPGTGKTTTVAKLLAVLHDQRPPRQIALAAPTGKAAARLEEAVRSATAELADADRLRLGDLQATTLRWLLGRRPGASSRFKHDRENHLPHDVVDDESSMMSLT